MESPSPPNRAQLCGCHIAFLERGPAAQCMEHLDWNCFLNRFFFSVYFSHILTFLKTPWPNAIKTLYTSAEVRGLCWLTDPVGFLLATRERPRTTAAQHRALGRWLGTEGKLGSPRPQAYHWGSSERHCTKE